MSDLMKGFFRGVRKQIITVAGVALKSGATNVGKQLVNVTSEENQPSGFTLGTLANALKSGIMDTGQDLMTRGLDRVKAISAEDQKSEVSEESTSEKQSEEVN
jgi:hypothetical protein